jgi:hypothetical protein
MKCFSPTSIDRRFETKRSIFPLSLSIWRFHCQQKRAQELGLMMITYIQEFICQTSNSDVNHYKQETDAECESKQLENTKSTISRGLQQSIRMRAKFCPIKIPFICLIFCLFLSKIANSSNTHKPKGEEK